MWALILEGLVIGVLLGLTGAGGGILAVPALMASQGWTVAQAAPVGLLAVTLSRLGRNVRGFVQAYCALSCCALDRADQYSFSPLWRASG